MERDGKTWVILQLTPYGEALAERGELYPKLRRSIPKEKEIFIPYHRINFQGKITKLNVLEGYCFVESGLEETEYFNFGLENYIEDVLHSKSSRRGPITLQTVRDVDVQKLKDSLQEMLSQDLQEDMVVTITSGIYKGLDGKVVGFTEDRENAFIYISLRSLKAIRTVPTILLTTEIEDV